MDGTVPVGIGLVDVLHEVRFVPQPSENDKLGIVPEPRASDDRGMRLYPSDHLVVQEILDACRDAVHELLVTDEPRELDMVEAPVMNGDKVDRVLEFLAPGNLVPISLLNSVVRIGYQQ